MTVGATIGRFHRSHIYHADLNARNILLQKMPRSAELNVYLIDFDRGRVRRSGRLWQRANLQRLKRSLEKFASNHPGFFYEQADWASLMAGYSAATN